VIEQRRRPETRVGHRPGAGQPRDDADDPAVGPHALSPAPAAGSPRLRATRLTLVLTAVDAVGNRRSIRRSVPVAR
jgi:hypothetical protein